MIIRLLDPAALELEEALIWYAEQSPGLKAQLLSEFERARERILEYPNAWHPLDHRLRRFRLDKFPYGLIYRISGDEIIVVAVAHLHCRPNYWRDRLSRT